MSVIRVGSTSKYADGWEQIFGGASGGARRGKPAGKKAAAKRTAKQPGRKKPVKAKASRTKAKSRGR